MGLVDNLGVIRGKFGVGDTLRERFYTCPAKSKLAGVGVYLSLFSFCRCFCFLFL